MLILKCNCKHWCRFGTSELLVEGLRDPEFSVLRIGNIPSRWTLIGEVPVYLKLFRSRKCVCVCNSGRIANECQALNK